MNVGRIKGTRHGILAALSCIGAVMADPRPGAPAHDANTKLLEERAATLASFADPHQSPLAAVAREDFQGAKPLSFGGAADDDVLLEGAASHAVRVRVEGDHFLVERGGAAGSGDATWGGAAEEVKPGTIVELGRYSLRLSHQNFPAAVVLDRESPRLREGPRPRWFAPDPSLRLEAVLVREAKPREEIVLSTRGNRRHALHVGTFELTLHGQRVRLSALRLLEPGVGEAGLSIFFRDATTGHESYPVGRYLEPEPLAGDRYVLDFNRAYNPTCAFSPLYNCPIPPRENVLPLAIRAGERDPGGH